MIDLPIVENVAEVLTPEAGRVVVYAAEGNALVLKDSSGEHHPLGGGGEGGGDVTEEMVKGYAVGRFTMYMNPIAIGVHEITSGYSGGGPLPHGANEVRFEVVMVCVDEAGEGGFNLFDVMQVSVMTGSGANDSPFAIVSHHLGGWDLQIRGYPVLRHMETMEDFEITPEKWGVLVRAVY